MDPLTASALAARDGDREALARFIRAGQTDVWRLAAHLVDRASADDVAQEALMRAIGALPSFRGDSSARTWLLAIARRTCVDVIRRRTRDRDRSARLRAVTTEVAELPADDSSRARVDELLAHLDRDRRTAFVLTQLLDYGYAEAAEVIGCPIGTVRSRVARAREVLIGVVAHEGLGRASADGA